MSDTLYAQFAEVLAEIFAQLVKTEQRLDMIEHTLGMNRAGIKKPVTNESEQAILR